MGAIDKLKLQMTETISNNGIQTTYMGTFLYI